MYFTPFICETPRLPSETLAASDPGYPSPQWRGEDSLAVPIGEGRGGHVVEMFST